MNEQNHHKKPAEYWYNVPGRIDRMFYGVFEGGGAKGIAYVGALDAMLEKGCWFKGVAGASAGAITAALVAAGMTPKEINTETDAALAHFKTSVWTGLRRLQTATGYFSSDGLRDWLNELLSRQIAVGTNGANEVKVTSVTFQELYDATGIELNIVAADLSLKTQVIFSYKETPCCAVSDAVVASSSIPFAFPSRLLEVNDGDRVLHHTIVDGGVWSNFPIYIFEDCAFRRFYERDPKEIEEHEILGFLLKESDQVRPPRGENVVFAKAGVLSAREWIDNTAETDKPAGLASTIVAWLLLPFYLLGRLTEWNSGVERGRWPSPRSKSVNYLVYSVNGLLAGIYPPLFGVLAFLLVAIGAWEVSSYLIDEQIRVILATDWSSPMSYVARLVGILLTLMIVAVAVLLPFVTLLGIATNRFLLRASRRILYGLVTTYVAGPGAPLWAEEKTNVVFLPIPPSVNTLSFSMAPEVRADLISGARQATLAMLTKVLSAERSPA